MFAYPQNSYIEMLFVSMTVFGGGSLRGNEVTRVEASWWDQCLYERKRERNDLSAMQGYSKKAAVCKPGRGPLLEPN